MTDPTPTPFPSVEQIREAAAKFPDTEAVLKILFPAAFASVVKRIGPGVISVTYQDDTYLAISKRNGGCYDGIGIFLQNPLHPGQVWQIVRDNEECLVLLPPGVTP